MSTFVSKSLTVLFGTTWTGTAPGSSSTPSGTISSATDLTSWVRAAPFEALAAMIEATTFGSGGYVERLPGLKDSTFSFEANDDFAAASLDTVLWTPYNALTLCYFDVKPTSSARSATNPSYVFAGYISKLPTGGTVGQLASKSVQVGTTGAYARLTS